MKKSVLAGISLLGMLIGPGCTNRDYPSVPPPDRISAAESNIAPGRIVSRLPKGYRVERIRGREYYYYDNVYYRPHYRGYEIVRPPR
jgi:hypothetical protein